MFWECSVAAELADYLIHSWEKGERLNLQNYLFSGNGLPASMSFLNSLMFPGGQV
jgi:hypothetical protein